jgi:hypothetical protein
MIKMHIIVQRQHSPEETLIRPSGVHVHRPSLVLCVDAIGVTSYYSSSSSRARPRGWWTVQVPWLS